LLAEGLGLQKDQYKVTFQSRLGRAQWLEPYTEPTLIAMAKSGVSSVDVICPGFTSDCLETLEEISMEAREAFLHAGGKEFQYIPCLNDQPEWIAALCGIAQRHMGGWDIQMGGATGERELSRQRALELGATQ
jgi:ferrochelatase